MRIILMTLALAATPAIAAPNGNARMLDRIGAADTNRDGNISKPELIAFRAANFSRLDRDGNGVLTPSDIPAFVARFNPDLDFGTLLKQFDANGDRRVSRDEFVNGPTVIFDAADSNGDGLLSAAERQAAIAAAKR